MQERDLLRHVEVLARRPRVPGTREHAQARSYVFDELRRHGYDCRIDHGARDGENVIAEVGNPSWPLFVVGAHYDSVDGSPGADDNASGVAALLEVARVFSAQPPTPSLAPPMRVQFVAFDREEDGLVGSSAHCVRLKRSGARLVGMMSLEMLGYTSEAQTLVPGVAIASTRGNFLAVVSDERSRHLLGAFQPAKPALPEEWSEPSAVPVECVCVSAGTLAAGMARLSDHGSFWDAGWPALLVTDTAFLRNPHYHRETDTHDTLDYGFLLQSTQKVTEALLHLTTVRQGLRLV